MSADWLAISNALAEATEKIGAHSVAVHTEARGSSSGVIWRPGIIVTTEHALRRDEEIQATLPDGKTAAAKLVGRDGSTDIAVLKCDEAKSAPSSFGDSEALRAGHVTLVVGRTRASGPVAALGFVSLVTKERRLWGGGAVSPYVRLDLALQRTAVGGAVVDATGKVVGVATPKFAPAGALLVPVVTVNRVVEALLEKGHIPRGYFGLGLQSVRLPEELRQVLQRKEKTAAIVLEVEPDGPASKAGVVIGDVLLKLDGKPVANLQDVWTHLIGESMGKPVRAEFLRGGAQREVSITVAERPDGSR